MGNKKSNMMSTYPAFKNGLGSAAAGLILLGLTLQWSLLFLIGLVCGIVWFDQYQRDKPKNQLLWQIIIISFVLFVICIAVFDVVRLYQ